ncbi:Lipase_3 domain-containing protein [Psidium guajava]|nr:Lipase_3 domain-containing protein [Psidium guajava]
MAGESPRSGRRADADCKSGDLGDLCSGGHCDFEDGDVFQYLVVNPHGGGAHDLLRYGVWGDTRSGMKFLESSRRGEFVGAVASDHRWVIVVSIIARRVIAFFGKPMKWTGFLVDFVLNLLSENGGFLGLLYNFILGDLTVPRRDSDTFISTIGHLDGRIDLYKGLNVPDQHADSVFEESIVKVELGHRALMDLCIMASKLAYENEKVVRNVVVQHWKMHFVGFYNCWNDYQMERSTQVFILCDKLVDANLILISFRGTEPFDADNWCTDFDYSWYEIPKLGKVHLGFLEALGLGNRTNTVTFRENLQLDKKFALANGADASDLDALASTSNNGFGPEMAEMSAYYAVRSRLKTLLEEHKNAKFVVTGHSLGGALAILFPTVLVLHEEMEVMRRLLGVYTFGQPRVGDRQLQRFMEEHLDYPYPKYFRVVYCNDVVPRLPYDDPTFLYKHFGICLYYDSWYTEQKMQEEPNKNYFGPRYLIPAYLNAVWELIRGLTMGYTHGPEYKEEWFSILVRVVGLVLPGLSAHSPTDYVNSVRLGKEPMFN